MTHFSYENLNDIEFENLVIRICKEILGIGCKTFSIGKDGAKDSWFSGKAQYFPSTADPWEGTFIIQAKHTQELNASCSDGAFSTNRASTINREIIRLNEIQKESPFENYLLFTNRKLSGGIYTIIAKMLQYGLGEKNAEIIGREQIDAYLSDYPHIANQFGLDKFIYPLRFYEKDIKEIIVLFSEQRKNISNVASDYIMSFKMIDKERKNELNNLSKDYFDFIKENSLQYFEEIDLFLKDPKNNKYTIMYANTVSELQESIILERSRFNEFEHIIKHLVNFLIKNNEDELRDLSKIVRVFIHFMYFNCDIGKTE